MTTPIAWSQLGQNLQTISYSPTVNASVAQVNLSSTQCKAIIDPHGDFEIEIRCIPQFDQNLSNGFTFFQGFDKNGAEYSLKYIVPLWSDSVSENYAGSTFTLTIAGNVIISGSTSPISANTATVLYFASGQEILVRAWYKPYQAAQLGASLTAGVSDTAGMRIEVMGLQNEGSQGPNYTYLAATGSPLAAMSSFSIGSNTDGSNAFNANVDQVIFRRTGPWYQSSRTPNIVLVGDSLLTSYRCSAPVLASRRAIPGYRSLPKFMVLAHPGATAAQMQNQVLANLGGNGQLIAPPAVVVDNSGINELQGGQTAGQVKTAKSALWSALRSAWPGVKIVCVLLGPTNNLSAGSGSGDSTTQNLAWQRLNQSPGNGGLQDLGADAYVYSHIATISGTSWMPGGTQPGLPSNSTAQAIQISAPAGPIYDGIHISNTARDTEGAAIVTAITSLGLWQG